MNFVTGGTGLLGSHLLFELSEKDMPVRAIYRNPSRLNNVKRLFRHYDPENWESRFERIEWVEGDIMDVSSLITHIDPDSTVYHCAALVSFDPKDFFQLAKINREGTANVVNAALANNAKALCYVSSTAAIGGDDTSIVTEETKWKNTPQTSAYSISKYGAEKEVWRGIEEGLPSVIVNPSVIFGPGNWSESSLTIFRTVGKGQLFYPGGANATVDARDVAEIMIRLAESDIRSERFLLIGANQPFRELMSTISTHLGKSQPKYHVNRSVIVVARRLLGVVSLFTGRRPAITKDTVNSLYNTRVYSNQKIKDRLGFEFRDLDEQVRNVISCGDYSKNS